MKKILELFSGTQSISKVFRERGWQTLCVELDPYFESLGQWTISVSDLTPELVIEALGGVPDVIWASPPCTRFTVARIGANWVKGTHLPKNQETWEAVMLLWETIELIRALNPKVFFIENPRGKMRKMDIMQDLDRYTVTYCQYGDTRMKPTDLWTNHPDPKFKEPCKNGDPCHVSAPRGSRTGTQGMKNSRERAVIPRGLCEHIADICEEVP